MNKYDCALSLHDRNSLSVLIDRIKSNSVVLEFGPANGRMTKYMKEQLNCKIYAVEIDTKSAEDAAQYTEKIVVDSIESYNWQNEFKNIEFDYIIFADVLEHLYYPEKALKSVYPFLKEDGSLLISIPNIAHNAIILGLLNNEFNYSPTGLLDDTHIRFFTKKTFDALIEKCGFFKAYETAIFINPENTELHNFYSSVPTEIEDYLHSLYFGEAYQLIYELKKQSSEIISDFSDDHKIYNQSFIQLFFDTGNGFNEISSIKQPISKNGQIQEFVFDLNGKQSIKALRLDPLNDSCVVEIEHLSIKTADTQEPIDITSYIESNAETYFENTYFFTIKDSQIYFSGINPNTFFKIETLHIFLKYLHTSEDVLYTCIKQKNQELLSKESSIQNLNQELIVLYTSRSWKLTRPLRKVFQKIKNWI